MKWSDLEKTWMLYGKGSLMRWIVVTIALALSVSMVGCAPATHTNQTGLNGQMGSSGEEETMGGVLHDKHEGDIPDERDIEVGRDLGLSNVRLEEMANKGMSLLEALRIGQAEVMLDHLEEKYGMAFRAMSIQEPELVDSTWRLVAEIGEGEHIGETITCIWWWDEEEEPHYTDNLVTIVRADEIGNRAWQCVAEAFGDLDAGGVGEARTEATQLPDAFTLDTDVAELSREVNVSLYLYLPPDTPLNQSEYEGALSNMTSLLKERDVRSSYLAMRLLDPEGRIVDAGGFTLELAQELASGILGQPLPKEGVDYDWRVHGSTLVGGDE